MNDDDELPATPEEIAEAEALARTLEAPGANGAATAGAPEDLVATATLLRRARETESAEGRAAERGRIAAAADRALPALDARRPVRRRWVWLAPALLIPSATLVLLLTAVRRAPSPGASTARIERLPAPPLALLEAQARAARDKTELAALDERMRDYRENVYAALAAQAGGER